MSISVAMAVYNGQAYLKEQMDSILSQLESDDEIIVSLDPSTDESREILEAYHDSRIRIFDGDGTGVIDNFENAISHCSNDFIFLSDQDDVWLPNKREMVLSCFDQGVQVVLHDARIVDADLRVIEPSFFEVRHTRLGIKENLIKNTYIGCCMAFRKSLVKDILPFPKPLPMHDQWIGLVGEQVGRNVLCNEPLLLYRRHDKNVTEASHASVSQMVRWRFQMMRALKRREK